MNSTASPALRNPEQWVEIYGDELYRYALLHVSETTLAEDLVQETFLAALRAREQFKGEATEKTWLIAILKNKIIDFFRKKNREVPVDEEETLEFFVTQHFDRVGHWLEGPVTWAQNPQQAAEQEEFLSIFRRCLKALSPRIAQVFSLREISGLSSKKICKELDISTSNLWVMLYRARLGVRRCLEKTWFDK